MLPDTVHKLPREERYAYARLLAFMARVDNELTVDEMAMFEQTVGDCFAVTKTKGNDSERTQDPHLHSSLVSKV